MSVWTFRSLHAFVTGKEKCIGTATVDLSPLACGLAFLSGWYNIVDFSGKCAGQLQVSNHGDSIYNRLMDVRMNGLIYRYQ